MLDKLSPRPGARRRRKRAGRGPGAARHKTAGRGVKGQGARSKAARAFEGGQTPMVRRIPKRGFKNPNRRRYFVLNLRDLGVFGAGAAVDAEALAQRGLMQSGQKVKLLGDGDAPAKCTVRVHGASVSARSKIEAAGGSVEIVG